MRRILLLGLLLLLAACTRGPGDKTLQADLQHGLQSAFPANVLSVTHLQRRGSSSDIRAPAGEKRVVVYFDSELRLEKDQDFGSWDSPGIASLISIVGAGPRGVSGIRTGGNRQGDRLQVHGSLIYKKTAQGWQGVVAQGFTAPRAAHVSEEHAESINDQLIGAISTALNLSPGGSSVRERTIVSDEISHSLLNIQGRLGRLQNGYPMAGGPPSGQYARLSKALAAQLKKQGVVLIPLTTEGGLDNLQLLRRGDAVLALSQSDVAAFASAGTGPFTVTSAYSRLRALASLYPEPVHVLVRGDESARSLTQLKGKRINLGPAGSGSRNTALAVLAAHGLSETDFSEVTELDLQQALTALGEGDLDGLIQVIGAPAETIRAAGESLDVRLIPLDPPAIEVLLANRPGTFATQITAGTYPHQASAIATLGVSSVLLCDERLSPSEVEKLVRFLFSQDNRWLAAGSIQGEQISIANARRGLAVPLHDGALKAWEALQ